MSVYAICLTLVLLSGKIENHGLLVVGLLIVAVVSSIPTNSEQVTQWRPVFEGVATVVLTSGTGTVQQALLPYLIAPALDAGLLGGLRVVIYETGFASATLLACGFLQQPDNVRAYTSFSAQWVVLSLAVGLLASWVRRIRVAAGGHVVLVLRRRVPAALPAPAGVPPAVRRPGLRRRSPRRCCRASGPGCATSRARASTSAPRAAGSSRWPLPGSTGSTGPRRSTTTRPGPTPGHRAHAQRVSADVHGGRGRLRGRAAAAGRHAHHRPGRGGADRGAVPPTTPLADAEALLDEAALRLETALLFSEVRAIATAEERRRLAREIHDGIAQELASLGYVVDDLSYRATDDEHRASSCRTCAAS